MVSKSVTWSKENESKISAESIYQWIYSKQGQEAALYNYLVRKKKRRGLPLRKFRGTNIKHRVSIHERPDALNQRSEFGHYECDLFFNIGSMSKNVCALIERTTRKATLIYNQNKSTEIVIGSIIEKIKKNNMSIKNITFDNGSEFASHYRLNERGIATYFCDPGAPWQKGSVENLNGMLRRYMQFKMPAADINESFVQDVNAKINRLPRAILSFNSPIKSDRQQTSNGGLSAQPAVEANNILFNLNNSRVAFHH